MSASKTPTTDAFRQKSIDSGTVWTPTGSFLMSEACDTMAALESSRNDLLEALRKIREVPELLYGDPWNREEALPPGLIHDICDAAIDRASEGREKP